MPRTRTDTKSRILKATRTLYSTHGCDGTTLEDIITASGITKGAFYHHFRSKQELGMAVLELGQCIPMNPRSIRPVLVLRHRYLRGVDQ